jgi:hypothetical protein
MDERKVPSMLEFDPAKLAATLQAADTADLLDRVTAYRPLMEPHAIEVIEAELRRRGVGAAQIADRANECQRECLLDATGAAFPCSRCRRPAVAHVVRWHRVWGLVPVFPRRLRLCREHALMTSHRTPVETDR